MAKVIIRYSILFIGLCLYSASLYAQNWNIKQYTEENGLPSNYLYALSDEKEKILLGTDVGLVLFDGHNFEPVDYLKNTYPIHLHRVSDSLLYISTFRNGIYETSNSTLKKKSASTGNIAIIASDTNFVFYYTLMSCADTTKASNDNLLRQLTTLPSTYGLSASKEGLYYFYQKTIGLINWQGVKIKTKNLNKYITAAFSLGEILITGHKNGKITRSKEGEELQHFQLDTDFDIQKIYKYNDSSLIVVNTKNEYDQLYFLEFNREFTKILRAEKLLGKNVEINDIFVKKGIVFCATFGEGLYVISPTAFLTIDTYSQNLPQLKNLIQDENEIIWGNSQQNIYKIDIELGVSKLTFNKNLISIINTKNNKSYIATTLGKEGTGSLYDMNLNMVASTSIKEVFYSNDSTILGYGKYHFSEINIIENIENKLFEIDNKDYIYGKLNAGAFADTVVFLGTDIGLIKLAKTSEGNWEKRNLDKLLRYFTGKKITQLLYKDDRLFVLTEGILFLYVNNKIEEIAFSDIPDIKVNKIMFDSKSNLLIGTNKGFWYLKPTEVLHYDKNNGLLSEKVYNFLEDCDSNIWAVTGKSLEVIKHEDLHTIHAPKLYFKDVVERANGISLTISSYQYDYPDDLKLEYKLNDELWIPLKTTFLELRNLAPENYTCYIRGKRNNSNWSSSLVYRFEVYAKWYQTNAFKFSIFIFLLIVSFLFFRFRLKKIRTQNLILESEITARKKLEKKVTTLREEISQDFHDELGNKIASISGISNTMIETVDPKDISKMREISKLSSEMYDSTKDFVWLLNPENNNLKSLCLYLRDYGENYFDLIGNIDFFFFQENIQEIGIPYEWMKNIVLTFKEITTNIVKHSSATEVTMDVKLEGDIFTIQIFDNGQGFVYDAIKQGNGLKNIVSRMNKLNAEINANYNKGVHYSFKLKMK